LKKKENVRLFFTSTNATIDMVLQSTVPVVQRKLSLQRWVIYSNELSVLFVFGATAPPVGHGLLIHEVSRSHTTTHHSR